MLWFNAILSFIKFLLLSNKFKKFDSKIPPNQTWWVLGNGPSLRQVLNQIPTEPQNQVFCVVNYFALTEDFSRLRPRAYVLSAPELTFMEENSIPEDILLDKQRLYRNLTEKTQWPMSLFVPYPTLKKTWFKELLKSNANIQGVEYNSTPLEGPRGFCNFAIEWGWGMPRPHNVLIPSVAIALRSKAKRVYMMGAEHSWIKTLEVNDDNVVVLDHQHFYDPGKQVATMDHSTFRPRRLHEVLQKFLYSFQSYWVLSDYSKKKGIEVVNLTPNSYIDAFKKRQFDPALFKSQETQDV
jgi:hypothetical protein